MPQHVQHELVTQEQGPKTVREMVLTARTRPVSSGSD